MNIFGFWKLGRFLQDGKVFRWWCTQCALFVVHIPNPKIPTPICSFIYLNVSDTQLLCAFGHSHFSNWARSHKQSCSSKGGWTNSFLLFTREGEREHDSVIGDKTPLLPSACANHYPTWCQCTFVCLESLYRKHVVVCDTKRHVSLPLFRLLSKLPSPLDISWNPQIRHDNQHSGPSLCFHKVKSKVLKNAQTDFGLPGLALYVALSLLLSKNVVTKRAHVFVQAMQQAPEWVLPSCRTTYKSFPAVVDALSVKYSFILPRVSISCTKSGVFLLLKRDRWRW